MRSFSLRAVLLQVHLWTGLVLGLVFVALGLTGSILVYRDGIENLLAPAPHASAAGTPQSLDALIAAAREGSGAPKRASAAITLPEDAGEPAIVRFQSGRPGMTGPGTGTVQVYVDPVSAAVLGTRKGAMSPLIQFAHDLHGQLFMGREGRTVVGWLASSCSASASPASCCGGRRRASGRTPSVSAEPPAAGASTANCTARSASGFGSSSCSSASAASPSSSPRPSARSPAAPAPHPPTTRAPVRPSNASKAQKRIGADQAAGIARAAVPAADIASVSIPAKPDQAIRVGLRATGAREGLTATVFVDPWAAKPVAVRDPQTTAQRFVAWQRPIHEGAFGPVWQFLVFVSGLLPLLFVITGLTMWLKKRAGPCRRRARRCRLRRGRGMNGPFPARQIEEAGPARLLRKCARGNAQAFRPQPARHRRPRRRRPCAAVSP